MFGSPCRTTRTTCSISGSRWVSSTIRSLHILGGSFGTMVLECSQVCPSLRCSSVNSSSSTAVRPGTQVHVTVLPLPPISWEVNRHPRKTKSSPSGWGSKISEARSSSTKTRTPSTVIGSPPAIQDPCRYSSCRPNLDGLHGLYSFVLTLVHVTWLVIAGNPLVIRSHTMSSGFFFPAGLARHCPHCSHHQAPWRNTRRACDSDRRRTTWTPKTSISAPSEQVQNPWRTLRGTGSSGYLGGILVQMIRLVGLATAP
mmetsp:Transcript_36974/g.96816  ORF Transcript_36974/g.96816 Transcript_36974/m.96816 type:complete len:256 (+) Transcript_36974:238-1005(+)